MVSIVRFVRFIRHVQLQFTQQFQTISYNPLRNYTICNASISRDAWLSSRHRRDIQRGLATETVATSDVSDDTGEYTIRITDATIARLRKVLDRSDKAASNNDQTTKSSSEFLRVAVDSGGCKGFNYTFKLDALVQPEDRVFKLNNICIVIDADSLPFLQGSTIDYSEELIRSSFRIEQNPQMKESCSCGTSFAPKF